MSQIEPEKYKIPNDVLKINSELSDLTTIDPVPLIELNQEEWKIYWKQ
jgi:hypothetical protein